MKMVLEAGKDYNVTVVNIVPVGAVVKMEDGTTELVHISNIAECYVADISNFVSIGDELVANCREGKKRPVELTFLPLHLESKVAPKSSKKFSRNIDKLIDSANSSFAEKQSTADKRRKRK